MSDMVQSWMTVKFSSQISKFPVCPAAARPGQQRAGQLQRVENACGASLYLSLEKIPPLVFKKKIKFCIHALKPVKRTQARAGAGDDTNIVCVARPSIAVSFLVLVLVYSCFSRNNKNNAYIAMDGAAECVLVAKEVEVKEKTGTTFSSVMHILTAVIGAGVLGIPYAVAQLGWVAGILVILVVYCVSLVAVKTLTYAYEVDGVQHPRYYEAVGHILGRRSQILAAVCQLSNLFLLNIAYTITASISMQSIASLACQIHPKEGSNTGDGCFNERWAFTIIFGGVQMLISQLGNLEESDWLSVVGALTSVSYCSIALGLSIAKVAEGNHLGTVGGVTYDSGAGKAFAILNALGTISFAYSFSQVLLEIQDTIREPPKARVTMQKAANIALTVSMLFYIVVAVFGYLAIGQSVPDMILQAFGSPKWLLIIANVLVLLHMVAAFNVFAQTVFLTLEGWLARCVGVRHPAEEAALQAAAAVVSTNSEAALAEEGEGKQMEREGKLASSCTTTLVDDARAASAPPVLDDSVHGLETQHSSHSTTHPHGMLQGGKLPSGALSARSLRRRAVPGKDAGQADQEDDYPWEPCSDPQDRPEVLHTVASLKRAHVSFIAGPFRMQSPIHCIHPVETRHSVCSAHPHSESGSMTGGKAGEARPHWWRFRIFSVVIRLTYVAVITALAVVLPFFSQVSGLIGGLIFWPLAIYFPFTMYMKVYKPGKRETWLLYAIMVFVGMLAAGATVGSFRNIIVSLSSSFCLAC